MKKWHILLLLAVCVIFNPIAIRAQDVPSALATVEASKLNVHSESGITYSVLMKVNRGETFPIIGRNANATWWQIHSDTLDGWMNARFVTVEHAADVPIVTTLTLTTSTSGCAFSTFMSPECPDKQIIGEVTTQKFENGMMLWFNDLPSIYVLFGYGLAEPYPNKWAGEALPQETPPAGLQQPQLGFGEVWLNYKEVRKGLGWATDDEIHYQATIEYTGGSTPYPSDDAIYVSLPNGKVIWYSPYHTSWGYSG